MLINSNDFANATPIKAIGSDISRAAFRNIFAAEFRAHSFLGRRPARPVVQAPRLIVVESISGEELLRRARRNRVTAISDLAARKAEFSRDPAPVEPIAAVA
jgi:hypothetical protein